MSFLLVKRIALVLLVLGVLLQIPFAVNRFRTARLASTIEQMASARTAVPDKGFRDYKGVFHVHSFLGGHSTGTFDELISAAESNGLDFVVMTEHVSSLFDSASSTLNGKHGRALWIGGNEISTADGDRFLVLDGFDGLEALGRKSTRDFLAEVHDRGKFAVIAYPEIFRSWDEKSDGFEVFSLNTNAKNMNPLLFFFDALWSYGAYPELTLAKYVKRPTEDLGRYDTLAQKGEPALFGGNDAHSNIGFHIGDEANNRWIDLQYDRYGMVFRVLRTHVLLRDGIELDRESLMQALKNGNSYISFDVLGDPSGFAFYAMTNDGPVMMGDTAGPVDGSTPEKVLVAESPLKARIVILKDGVPVFEVKSTNRAEYRPREDGAYRTEIYLDSLGSPFESVPWIMSNPVFVR